MSTPRSNSFTFGSASSAYSVRDAIASYRRSQYLTVNANVARTPSDHYDEDEDEEATTGVFDEYEEDEAEDMITPRPHSSEATEDVFDWDGTGPIDELGRRPSFRHEGPGELLPASGTPQPILLPPAQESTPLLRKAVSFSHDAHLEREHLAGAAPKARRVSEGSLRTRPKHEQVGKSTFGQTLFNSIAILLGIGMLSEPIAFANAGWVGGIFLIISYGFVTCYTAKILGRIILSEGHLRSYADIGQKAFGPKSIPFISGLFCLELFAVSVALVTLSADSLHSLIPAYSSNTFKLWGALVLIPTVFMPLSLISYTSILGITSTIYIVAVVFIDGLSKREAPGSLWEPAQTSLLPGSARDLGVSFGLFMAGFSGHAVIPSLARDMADPTRFEEMINYAFAVATAIYIAIGCAGYLMFGNNVHDEISVDLLGTAGYNAVLNTIALWTFVISPMTKFALVTRPVAITLEIMLGLEERLPPTAPDDHAAKPRTLSFHGHPPTATGLNMRRFGVVVERAAFTMLSIFVSIGVPEFSSMMALIGSFAAFLLCIIGPLFAKRSLHGLAYYDNIFLVVAVIMTVWGTAAAFWAAGSSTTSP